MKNIRETSKIACILLSICVMSAFSSCSSDEENGYSSQKTLYESNSVKDSLQRIFYGHEIATFDSLQLMQYLDEIDRNFNVNMERIKY
ncbi:MAG: hypothetical protein IJ250_03810 [Bacteroidales bacterium]|nr:hypothetical protein [Bacteroidales bacterium]